MKKYDYNSYDENEHIINNWEPLSFKIKDNYQFIKNGKFFCFFSNIFFFIAYIIISIWNIIFLGFKYYGKNNLPKDTGYITISNHIHILDCSMIAVSLFPKRIYFPTLEGNFKIPVIRHIIRFLYATPIPKDKNLRQKFYTEINTALKNNKKIHMYPEAALWPYYEEIRNFKIGAFKMAVDANVPIVSIRFIFEKGKGLYTLKRKKCIHEYILEPIYPNNNLEYEQRIEDLKDRCYKAMKEGIK